jgi:hypothetical protein
VTVAYENLLAEGFATSYMGAGTFVSHQREARRPASKTRRSMVRAIRVRGVWGTISAPTVFVRADFDFKCAVTPWSARIGKRANRWWLNAQGVERSGFADGSGEAL